MAELVPIVVAVVVVVVVVLLPIVVVHCMLEGKGRQSCKTPRLRKRTPEGHQTVQIVRCLYVAVDSSYFRSLAIHAMEDPDIMNWHKT